MFRAGTEHDSMEPSKEPRPKPPRAWQPLSPIKQPRVPAGLRRLIKDAMGPDEAAALAALKTAELKGPADRAPVLLMTAQQGEVQSARLMAIAQLGEFLVAHDYFAIMIVPFLVGLTDDISPEIQAAAKTAIEKSDGPVNGSPQSFESALGMESTTSDSPSAFRTHQGAQEETAVGRGDIRRPAAAARRRSGQSTNLPRRASKPTAGNAGGSAKSKRG